MSLLYVLKNTPETRWEEVLAETDLEKRNQHVFVLVNERRALAKQQIEKLKLEEAQLQRKIQLEQEWALEMKRVPTKEE